MKTTSKHSGLHSLPLLDALFSGTSVDGAALASDCILSNFVRSIYLCSFVYKVYSHG